MATHGTMQTHDVTLHVSYHSNRIPANDVTLPVYTHNLLLLTMN